MRSAAMPGLLDEVAVCRRGLEGSGRNRGGCRGRGGEGRGGEGQGAEGRGGYAGCQHVMLLLDVNTADPAQALAPNAADLTNAGG
ncbi:MAG: hypothetical protein DCF30_22125 [Hyphomicrobiales bacterium]|nr:MAG: hypothetical protein DCF30_22125 [Hyphomicrobiales bacterium]